MHDDGDHRHAPRSGDWAIALGVAALVCALVPVVGDAVASVLAVVAVALGSACIHVAERSGRPGVARGLTGASIGLVALAVALFSVVAGMGHDGA
ncbi:hypothetical protein ACNHYB_08670 [Isoptericola jiangsuensis]|uniref:hypothetical protein n=1 Tax=Isoptericola jiangsuensis TaxID=548579 RepID=UPI003AABA3F9